MTTRERLARVAIERLKSQPHGSAIPPTGHMLDAVDAILKEARKPSEGVKLAGLAALHEVMIAEKLWWDKQGLTTRDGDTDLPALPTEALPCVSTNQSEPVWQAMIDAILEGKG